MKKIIYFAIALTIFCMVFCVTASAEKGDTLATQTHIMGDVDGDGEITSTDYLIIKSTFLGTYSLKGTAFAMADVDYDGSISSTDYLEIKSKLLGVFELEDKYASTENAKTEFVFSDLNALEFVQGEMEGIEDLSAESDISSDEFVYNPGINYYNKQNIDREKNYTDENGVDHSLLMGTYISTIKGTDVIRYMSADKATYYFNKNNDFIGYMNNSIWLTKYISENSSKPVITEEDAIELCTAKVKELFPEMALVYQGIEKLGPTYAYACTYQRFINNIKTVEKVRVCYNKYGEYIGYRYFESKLSSYDIRTFDINDNADLYLSRVTEAIANLGEKCPSCSGSDSINLSTSEITISDIEFGVGADGSLAGWADVVISDKETGETLTTFYDVGFYAITN